LQTTGRPKNQSEHATGRNDEQSSTLKRRVTTAAVACDHVLHGVGRSVFILAPFVILALLIGGLGYVRLRHGPISLSFLVEPIERGINAELGGNSVRIDDAVVSLSETGGLEFRLRNIRLREKDGDVVASAPFAAVELSAAALWSMRIVPARIELIEPRLFLFYSEGGGLTMSFSKPVVADARVGADAPPSLTAPSPVPATRPAPPVAASPDAAGPLKRIDLARIVTDMSSRARQRLDASSYLREIGLRNATVLVDYAGRTTEWRVPTLIVGLMHGRARSVISGRASVAAAGGKPWQLTFETDESERNRTLTLKTSVKDLVPRSIAGTIPQLSLLQAFDMPVDGNATLELTSDGDVRTATLGLGIGHGSLRLPALPEAPLEVDGGSINVAYDGVAEKVTLAPSTLSWRGSRITIAGGAEAEKGDVEHPAWTYQLRASEGTFAAEEFHVPPVALDEWHASGRILPHRGVVELAEFKLRAGGAEVALSGSLVTGAQPASTRLEGTLGPMPLNTLKALWPKAIAPGARDWVGERVRRASILGGKFRFLSGEHLAPDKGVGPQEHQLSFLMDAADLEIQVIDDLPPVVAARATTRIENDGLEVNIPEAAIVLAPDRSIPLQGGRFTAVDIMSETPIGEIEFTSQPALGSVIELLERSPLTIIEETGLPREGIEGKVDAKFKIGLPLLANLPTSAIKVEAKAHITDGRIKQFLGTYQVQSASFDLDISEKAAGANGQMLVNGVLAKLSWQKIFDAPLDKQPPLRVTATLDNTDRSQLGLDINHIVQGEVPIELTVTRGVSDEPLVRLNADLTNAEVILENVAWRKPPGRSATLQCDIARGKTYKTELQNFKVAGDDVAIEGWAAIGADNRLREFYFPDFSLNVVTRMEVQGTLGSDDIWKVKARGPTFDGRDFFRSLFSLGQLSEKAPKPKNPHEGIDLEAEIGTVIGYSEVSLRNLKMKLAKRGEKLTALDVRGTLDGGKPLAVVLRQEPGEPRKLFADSTDAGQAFKLIDFYPNIQGGRVRLEVNLEGKGAAEKTGILWVEQFRILGDPVVSEVFGGADDDGRPAIDGAERPTRGRRVVREVFDFNSMRVPFSVGYGQFVMEDSQLRGPMLGASIRGTVDFKMRRVNLGGTYVPLQGLNSALCEIPLFGPLITGPKCEGVTGMTFAIQGSMERPQVIVNPLSMLAPGIFRDIFQMTPFNPTIQRRGDDSPAAADDIRASSTSIGSPAAPGERTQAPGTVVGSDTIDGWSSQTSSPKKKR
jgi:AsmA-like C-terminal region/Protein of unknown function